MWNCLAVSDKAVRSPKAVRHSSIGTSKDNRSGVRSGRDGGNSANKMSILPKMDVDFPNRKILLTSHLKKFTRSELKSATSTFRDAIIGGGGLGKVFKGWLDEKTLAPANPGTGMATAVEKLNAESMQGSIQEWQSEIQFLGRLSHPNLIKLLGYCLDEKEVLLVYEFMAEGSLEQHLLKKVSQPLLSWSTRLKILIGAARGLAFLHTSDKEVIFRDFKGFKTSNILLDSNYHAKLSYFGLAKKGPPPKPIHPKPKRERKLKPVSLLCISGGGRVMGTYGYPDPKDVATGDYRKSDDVYEFGGVLLEMLTGLYAEPNPSLSDVLGKLLDPGLPLRCAAAEDFVTGDLHGNAWRYGLGAIIAEKLRPLDTSRPSAPQNLVESTRPSPSDRLEGVMDTRVKGQYLPEAALEAARLSLKCLHNDPRSRPSMQDVVEALERIEAMPRGAAPPAKPKTTAPPAKPKPKTTAPPAKPKTTAPLAKLRAAKPKTTAPAATQTAASPAKLRAAKPKTTAPAATQTAASPAKLRAAKPKTTAPAATQTAKPKTTAPAATQTAASPAKLRTAKPKTAAPPAKPMEPMAARPKTTAPPAKPMEPMAARPKTTAPPAKPMEPMAARPKTAASPAKPKTAAPPAKRRARQRKAAAPPFPMV